MDHVPTFTGSFVGATVLKSIEEGDRKAAYLILAGYFLSGNDDQLNAQFSNVNNVQGQFGLIASGIYSSLRGMESGIGGSSQVAASNQLLLTAQNLSNELGLILENLRDEKSSTIEEINLNKRKAEEKYKKTYLRALRKSKAAFSKFDDILEERQKQFDILSET